MDLLTLLDAWAAARPQPPARRALALLSRLGAEPALADLAVGDRDRRLLALLEADGPATLGGTVACAACDATIEVEAPVAALRSAPAAARVTVEIDGMRVRLRMPTTADIEAASAAPAPARRLAALCAERSEVSAEAAEAIGAALAAADPLLDPEIAADCPACGAEAVFGIDVAEHVWSRFEGRALAAMRQVDILARAYGWSEREVAALPPARRAAYVAMALA